MIRGNLAWPFSLEDEALICVLDDQGTAGDHGEDHSWKLNLKTVIVNLLFPKGDET